VKLALELNERPAELEAEPDEMLLDLLRREGLTSVRATCGIGVCGACTVLLDDEPVSGCLLLAAQAQGRRVTTVEGLPAEHPVSRAFEAEHAFQCGWCTPGMVLTAKRLLEENPNPSDQEIAAGLGGNLCRCGCYVKIRGAIRRAAA
jgi:aerobic-type carbon monoxide dehydrogenase small subunit (CoxS/CutS family)